MLESEVNVIKPVQFIPQSYLYTIFSDQNPLRKLAQANPEHMCWLACFYYVALLLEIPDDRRLRISLTYFLSKSLGLLFVNKETGALHFPKKYELSNSAIQQRLNEVFSGAGLKIKVVQVFSDITHKELAKIIASLTAHKKLLAIINNQHIADMLHYKTEISMNHAIVITDIKDLQNGRVVVTFLDPSDANFHRMELGINVFMQWIQYIWVLERRYSIIDRVKSIFTSI